MQPDIIAIGASAGGLSPLTAIVKALPGDFSALILVVVHTSPNSPGVLPSILSRSGPLPARYASGIEPLEGGQILVAPPDLHLLYMNGSLHTVRGPKENGFRPAIDPLFRTLARGLGPKVSGVVLSGARDDGAYGLALVKEHGGTAIVQDPDDCLVPSMPRSALAVTAVDHILPAIEIGPALVAMLNGISRELPAKDSAMRDNEPGEPIVDKLQMEQMPGAPSALTCPECGGALWELDQGNTLRYRCHVGHGFSPEALLADGTTALESALWNALRALKEQAALRRRLAQRVRGARMASLAERYEEDARNAEERADVIRGVLLSEPSLDWKPCPPYWEVSQRRLAAR